MAKKKKPDPGKPPIVASRHGRLRYQRGIVTATLMRWGLPLQQAVEAAAELRERLLGRETIEGDELERMMERYVASEYRFVRPEVRAPEPSVELPMVNGPLGRMPFSRGVLVRRLVACGLVTEEAMAAARRVGMRLHDRGEIDEAVLDDVAADVVGAEFGEAFARRFRVTSFIRGADRPVLLLIGGAVGTGKSTVATELAYRLGFRNVTTTDMVRETMRTVLSPQVVPGLHDHSFRGMLQGGPVLSDPRERVLVGFRQQAAQVAVGLGGVVRRAIREGASIIVEGTHLVPPFTGLLPSPADAHAAAVMLVVSGADNHRARFPARATATPNRRAEPYLDAFESVRWIQEDLLVQAEAHEAHVLENIDVQQTVTDVVEYLSQVLPIDAHGSISVTSPEPGPAPQRTLMLVFDGLGDRPHPVLAGRTPLAAAKLPTVRQLAGAGGQGQLLTTPEGVQADTAGGLMRLLGGGDSPRGLRRGLVEAVGRGLELTGEMVLLRGNLATLDPAGVIVDRRAGRIREGVESLLQGLQKVPLPGGVVGSIHAGLEHRVVVELRGAGLSPEVEDTDPKRTGVPAQRPAPMDSSPEAARTAEALAALLRIAREHLGRHALNEARGKAGRPRANAILTRGAARPLLDAARRSRVQPAAIVSGCPTALGVGKLTGLTPVRTEGMTGNLDTDVAQKLRMAETLLTDCALVAVHFKGTDIAAHDRRPDAKVRYLERVDEALEGFFERLGKRAEGLRVVVAADHGTSSVTGDHLPDPVPLLVTRWNPDVEPTEFDETTAESGVLGLLTCEELSELLWGEVRE